MVETAVIGFDGKAAGKDEEGWTIDGLVSTLVEEEADASLGGAVVVEDGEARKAGWLVLALDIFADVDARTIDGLVLTFSILYEVRTISF
jgi:hypothetical protein